MAELLSPGIFIEEVPAQVQVVQAVSTSNMGVVGFTQRGPTDSATLVTSLNDFFRQFGTFVRQSFVPLTVAAFFQNGGQRAYIVRVVPSDAVLATAKVQSVDTDQVIETGDGIVVAFTKTALNTTLHVNGGVSPIRPSTLSLRWRAAGVAVASQNARTRAATADLAEATAVLNYEGRIDPFDTLLVPGSASPNGDILFRSLAGGRTDITIAVVVDPGSVPRTIAVVGSAITVNPATTAGVVNGSETATAIAAAINIDPVASLLVAATAQGSGASIVAAFGAAPLAGLPLPDYQILSVVPGTLVVSWKANGVTKTVTFVSPLNTTVPTATATNVAGSSVTVDLRTGRFSLSIAAAEAPVVGDNGKAITVAYTPAGNTISVADNGLGVLPVGSPAVLTAPGAIDYTTGAYNFTTVAGAKPFVNSTVYATYTINAWSATPISKGVWGNGVQLQVHGNADNFDALTQSFTSYDVFVLLQNPDTGLFQVQEIFEDLNFTDPTTTNFWADTLNQLSNFARIAEPGGDEAPGQLSGIQHTQVLCGGEGTSASQVITSLNDGPGTGQHLYNAPFGVRSLKITYKRASDSAVRTIVADSLGNLTGPIDATYVTPVTVDGLTVAANTVNYTTGAFNFKTLETILPCSLVTATYATVPVETTHTETMGDTSKGYTAGTDGTFTPSTYGRSQFTDVALTASFQGLYALSRIDDIMQVCVPDFAGDVVITQDLLTYAQSRASGPAGGDRFIILTVPKGSTALAAVDWFRFQLATFSDYAALYWPWVKVADPLAPGRVVTMPPLGHIAGIYARTDQTRNVGKAPGGTIDGQLRFLTGLEVLTTQGDRDLVYPNKINPLISSPQTGLAVWGVRTISSQSQWRYINARRLFMFLEKSIYNSTFWIVFENNGPNLWARIKAQLSSFMQALFSDGLFAGTTPNQAYFVTVDATNNSSATVEQGQVIIDVGASPNRPAEFVRFRFQQMTLSS